MSLITRNAMRSYMECDGIYCEIGEGFTEFTESKNPREYARQYVNEAVERTDVVGFASAVSFAFDVYDEDPVAEKLLSVTLSEAVGDAAVVTVVTAFLHRASASRTGQVEAVRRTFSVCPGRLGSGTDALICAGTLKAHGMCEYGTFDPDEKKFYLQEG